MSKLRIHNFSFGKAGSNFLTKTWLDTSSSPPRKQTVHYYLNEKYLKMEDHSCHHDPQRSSIATSSSTLNPSQREYNIFFPGDIQLTRSDFIKYLNSDYPFEEEDMNENANTNPQQQHDLNNTSHENHAPAITEVYYEKVFDLLYEKFPNSVAYLIFQPSQLDYTSLIYEYENFYVKGNANRLVLEILNDLFPHEYFGHDTCQAFVHLLAFSKGCVALNSLISETTNFQWYLEQEDAESCITFDHWKNTFKYRHWDENTSPLVQKCYRVPLLQEHIPLLNNTNFKPLMQQAVNFFKNQVKTIYYLDGHRFITDEVILQKFYSTIVYEKSTNSSSGCSTNSSNPLMMMIKIYQTPLVEEKNIYRKHIKMESEGFMKILKRTYSQLSRKNQTPCPNLVYQYYYGELENRVNPFVLHFKLLKDFQI
ncbi:hypothetical protein C9374_012691 [Naegleria lovaniensis]|uniref:Uncharacterized protein n=1 Tax=Naegleria lovaniensis TaxID=51637 RepID=A0AA88KR76_NAELO|nr:uncharacterized protein C9374_012691 [Naegleria lovaniensis]KAG2392439.1 hypothetical protein C9374_012691 [Naegleria lovaniensis]